MLLRIMGRERSLNLTKLNQKRTVNKKTGGLSDGSLQVGELDSRILNKFCVICFGNCKRNMAKMKTRRT